MRAGTLRHPVRVQEAVETNDGLGSTTREWRTLAEIRVGVRPITAREIQQAGKVEGELTHIVSMRDDDRFTLNTSHRLCFTTSDRILNVSRPPVDMDERGRELTVYCRERTT